MKLGRPPPTYDQQDQAQTRAAIEMADRENLKTGQNIVITPLARLYQSYKAAITARSGGGQTSAVLLSSYMNYVQTAAAGADSVKLLPALAGLSQVIVNRGGNAIQVFGSGSDVIDEVATATGKSQANNTVALYVCPLAGHWFRLLSA